MLLLLLLLALSLEPLLAVSDGKAVVVGEIVGFGAVAAEFGDASVGDWSGAD
jgi:hypothetical protein